MTCPTDVAKPAGFYLGRQSFDNRSYRYQAPRAFYESTEAERYTIDFINGIPFIMVRALGGSVVTLQSFSDPTDFSGVSMQTTSRTFIYGTSALFGTFTDAAYTITWDVDSNQQDLSGYARGVAMLPFLATDVSKIAAVRLNLITNGSNYFTVTSTVDAIGDTFTNGWNIARFDLANRTQTGTPLLTQIAQASIEVEMNTGETQVITIDEVTLHTTEDAWFEYYTNRLFKSTDGSLKVKPTSDSDIVDLEDEEMDIFLYEVRKLVVQDATYDGIDSRQSDRIERELARKYELYFREHPSSQMPMTYNISSEISKDFLHEIDS